jgi:hypothetical protein
MTPPVRDDCDSRVPFVRNQHEQMLAIRHDVVVAEFRAIEQNVPPYMRW